jgi:predicted PurR-regulated permease PerM
MLSRFQRTFILLTTFSFLFSMVAPLCAIVGSNPWDHEQQVIAEVMPTQNQLQSRLDQLAERVRDVERESVISPAAEREFVEAKIAFRSGNSFVAMQHLTAAERALPKRSMHPIDNRVAR